ncbi:hypothetical protein ACQP2Y_36125 [Actinoplanes sp. CA-051413]|uniref:hypothetical protein n=1 Tax=Actinoplanes sp. CA-051413 TaxID=3239899 RepID=UPI003D968E12
MTTRFLVGKFIRFHFAAVCGLAGTAFVLAIAFAGANILQASVTAATEQAVAADAGGRAFAVQVLDEQQALPVLSRRTDLLAVIDSAGKAASRNAESPAGLRFVSDPTAELGLLVEGRYPVRPDEATISSFLADALGLRVGDESIVTDAKSQKHPVRVSGITSSPANDDDLTVVLLSDDVDAREATVFLTHADPFTDRELGPLLDRRVLKGRTVEILAEDEGSSTRSAVLSMLSYATPALSAISISLILALLAMSAYKVRRDASALQASGMERVRSWRIVGYAGAAAVLMGTVSGSILTLAAATVWRSHLSAIFGQDWQTIAASWLPLAVYVAGVPTLVILVLHTAPAYLLSRRRRRIPRISVSARVASAVMAVWAVMLGLTLARVLPVQVGGAAGAAAVVVAPVLIAHLASRSAGTAERRVVRMVAHALLPVVIVAALLTWVTTMQSAAGSHNAISMRETSPMVQPSGSLLLTEVPSKSGDVLRASYRRLGGKSVVTYRLPDETSTMVRAASAELTGCMKRMRSTRLSEVDLTCFPPHSIAPINIIALSSGDSTAPLTADPSLIQSGVVGLLTLAAGSDVTSRIEESPASGDALLGGNMPGAVLPAEGALAHSLKLRATNGEFIAFLDFAKLPTVSQAQFRSDVARLASAGQVAEERSQYEGADIHLALARAWSASGGLLLVVLLGFGGATIVSVQARLRRTLIDIGGLPRRRRMLTAQIFAVPMVSVIFATGLGLCSAWLQGVHNGAGFGLIWLIPGGASLAAIAALGIAFHRVPSRTVIS